LTLDTNRQPRTPLARSGNKKAQKSGLLIDRSD
jgi:hypothetical protein